MTHEQRQSVALESIAKSLESIAKSLYRPTQPPAIYPGLYVGDVPTAPPYYYTPYSPPMWTSDTREPNAEA